VRPLRLSIAKTVVLVPALAAPIAGTCGCRATPDGHGHGSPAEDGAADAGCPNAVPLLVTTRSSSTGSAPERLYVPAEYEGAPAAFLLDTGSPVTFLHEPLPDGGARPMMTPDAGAVVLGCQRLALDGYPVAETPAVHGVPIAGTLGDDRLLASPVEIDIDAGQVLWSERGMPFPEAATWPSSSYDRPGGYVRLHDVTFDGTPVELVLDTGSPNSLWLGQNPEPGDVEVDGEDSEGGSFKMYLGTVVVAIGDFRETVPVYRVPSFPYLQAFVNELGGHMNGMFGLSAFARGVVFDTSAGRVRVAP
jgi:hypothetical protein